MIRPRGSRVNDTSAPTTGLPRMSRMTSTQNASIGDFGTQSRLLPARSNTFFVSVLLRRGSLNVSWYGSSASARIVAEPSSSRCSDLTEVAAAVGVRSKHRADVRAEPQDRLAVLIRVHRRRVDAGRPRDEHARAELARATHVAAGIEAAT